MRRRSLPFALAVLLLLPAATAQAAPPTGSPSADPTGRYIVVLKKNATLKKVKDRHAKKDGTRAERSFSKVLKGFSGKLTAAQLRALKADPDVAAVVPDELIELAAQSTPTGIQRIGGKTSPAAKIDGVDQRVDADVAVVDTGIDATHPDLNVAGGVNCSTADRTAWHDDNHHGTHVAGTIGAIDNGIGVVGVAPGVRLWAVRILDAGGAGLLSWYVCGLDWIATQRDPGDPSRPLIEAVNMSVTKWGVDDLNCGYTNNDVLHQAICRVTAAGITVVAAAANDAGSAAKRVPASYNEVITVSALADTDGKPGALGGNRCYSWGSYDVDDTFADFSNYGADVDLIAPGKCIWSTLPGNSYGYSSGTSMAAPAVTGAAALYRASRPWTTPAQVLTALQFLGNVNWTVSSDPDARHERLLNVSRLGPAGDFTVAVGGLEPLGETGGTRTVPVTVARTATHFETIGLTVTAPAAISATLTATSLTGFMARNAAVTIVVPPSTPAGTYHVTVTGAEGPHIHSGTTAVVVENDPPTAFAPVVGVAASAAGYLADYTGTRLRVSWPKATDASSRIVAYQLAMSIDGAAWGATRTFGPTVTSTLSFVKYGHAYQFRVRAQDAAGNWSEWQLSTPMTLRAVEDTSTSMRWSTGWTRMTSATASGGRYRYASRSGASVSLTTTGRHLAVLGRVSPYGGSASVYVNGVYQGRLSMYASKVGVRRVVWAKDFGTSATRTITIRNLGTAGHPRIYLDAILFGR